MCHDLGHGPFSHLFDGKFLPAMGVKSFVHEHASIGLLDLLIEENSLWPELRKNNLHEAELHFIKELILGDEHEAPDGLIFITSIEKCLHNHYYLGFKWIGKPNKSFLFDIVANKRNGIDVDKVLFIVYLCVELLLSI